MAQQTIPVSTRPASAISNMQQQRYFYDSQVWPNLVKNVMFGRKNWSCEQMFNPTQINDLVMQCNADTMLRLQHNALYVLLN